MDKESDISGYKKSRLDKNKYFVFINKDGEPKAVDPNAQYFVLRIDEDPHARRAVAAYADSVKEDNPAFSADLVNWLHSTRNR